MTENNLISIFEYHASSTTSQGSSSLDSLNISDSDETGVKGYRSREFSFPSFSTPKLNFDGSTQ